MKKSIALICLCSSFAAHASNQLFNMAYVETNTNKLSNAGCFIRSDNNKPFFNMVSVFAANINGSDPNTPVIYFNPNVDQLLNHTNQVQELQNKGIKVLLTLLGNHENAGWSCMTDDNAIKSFANDVVNTVNKYNLDGVDIDDEYSACRPNTTSMIRITQAIKNNPGFKGKILSKALYDDSDYFSANYNGHKLAEYLDYAWEMSYGTPSYDYRLSPYVNNGVQKLHLALGESTRSSPQTAQNAASYIMNNGYGGMMIYNVKDDSQNYLSSLAQTEFGTDVYVEPNCL